MHNLAPLTQLLQACKTAIRKGNLEKCFELLEEALAPGEETEAIRNKLIHQEGRLNRAQHEFGLGLSDAKTEIYNQISVDMLTFLGTLEEKHLTLLNRVNDVILIFTPLGKEAEWQSLFSEKSFSHAKVIRFGNDIPTEYQTPDVVIFDDSGPDARPFMMQYAKEMPLAHFLYFGETNPFTKSREQDPTAADIFDRCANANSKITVHARLRELLEFRKM